MPAITSANVAQAIVKLVAADALPALVGQLVMGNLVNRDYEPVLAQSGDTVNIPISPVLTANNIAEGGTVATQNPSLGNAQLVLNRHIESTFQIPDVTRCLAVPDLLMTYMSPAMIALAEAMETDLLNLYAGLTVNTAVGGITAMDEARIDLADTELVTSKVPMNNEWNLVLSPTAYGQVRQIGRFTELQTIGSGLRGVNSIENGMVMMVKGFRTMRSVYVAKPSTTTFNVAFHRNAFGMVMRRLPIPLPGTGAIAEYAEMGNFGMRITMSYQPNVLAQQFTVDVLYGTGILRASHGVQVQSN
jgi:hypothetical protein